MDLPELKPTMNYDKPQIISEDDLHWFANCLTLPVAAELARRSNLFPKLLEMLEFYHWLHTSTRHCPICHKEFGHEQDCAMVALLSEARQQEQKGGEHE